MLPLAVFHLRNLGHWKTIKQRLAGLSQKTETETETQTQLLSPIVKARALSCWCCCCWLLLLLSFMLLLQLASRSLGFHFGLWPLCRLLISSGLDFQKAFYSFFNKQPRSSGSNNSCCNKSLRTSFGKTLRRCRGGLYLCLCCCCCCCFCFSLRQRCRRFH